MAKSLVLNNGQVIPTVGLGTWKADPGVVGSAVKHALKVGYRHLDCAFVYGNEKEVGEAIKNGMDELGIKRTELFVTSKLWNTKHHPEDVEPACRESLRDLGLEYIDLYLIHWPNAFKRGEAVVPLNPNGGVLYDYTCPVETWLAMEKLVEKGLVKSIGLSNFNSEQIAKICEKGSIVPVTNQVECHPFLSQEKLRKFCQDRNIFLTAYSPLGSPNRPWINDHHKEVMKEPVVLELAEKHKRTPAQIVLRWQIQREVVVIPKSTNPTRIEQNFKVYDFELDADDMQKINSLNMNMRLIEPVLNGKPMDSSHPHYPFNIEF